MVKEMFEVTIGNILVVHHENEYIASNGNHFATGRSVRASIRNLKRNIKAFSHSQLCCG